MNEIYANPSDPLHVHPEEVNIPIILHARGQLVSSTPASAVMELQASPGVPLNPQSFSQQEPAPETINTPSTSKEQTSTPSNATIPPKEAHPWTSTRPTLTKGEEASLSLKERWLWESWKTEYTTAPPKLYFEMERPSANAQTAFSSEIKFYGHNITPISIDKENVKTFKTSIYILVKGMQESCLYHFQESEQYRMYEYL